MGIPAEMTADGFHTVVTPVSPALGILTGTFQCLLKRTGISDIDQQSVVTSSLNVARPSVIGRHHRQAAGSGFEERQTKGFGQRWVNEQTSFLGGPSINRRNLGASMLFGVRNGSVEIVAIHQIEHLLKHITLLFLQLTWILTTAQHQHQVVAVAQHG